MKSKPIDRLAHALTLLMTTCAVVAFLGIVLLLAHGTFVSAGAVNAGLPGIDTSQALRARNSITYALYGTAYLTLLITAFGAPLGVAAGIALSEFLPPRSRFTRLLKAVVTNTAGVPSVVFGMFGLAFFVMFVGRRLDAALGASVSVWGQPCLLWSACTLALFTLPTTAVATEEALRAVPPTTREGSLALGATRFYTLVHALLPRAWGGILAGIMLAIARAMGEVAPLLFIGAAAYAPYAPTDVRDSFMHLGVLVFTSATQSADIDAARPTAFAAALALTSVSLLVYGAGLLLRHKMRTRFTLRS